MMNNVPTVAVSCIEQWQELKETIIELRDNNGTSTQQEACKFLANLMDILEKQMQEPSGDAISRKAVLDYIYNGLGSGDEENGKDIDRQKELESSYKYIKSLPPAIPQPKMGRWILTQRDRYIDLNCSECGSTRLKDFAYGYIVGELDIKEINDLIMKLRMNYCECCGAKMQEIKE